MANSFVHVELSTDNIEAAKSFYKKVFDWDLTDMPMGPGMTYTMVKPKEGVGGGMQDKNAAGMGSAPTSWLPYVQVDSVKKTIAAAKKGGAQIVVDFQEVSGMGALGIFVDPTGAPLGVWETAPGRENGQAAQQPQAEAAPKKAAAKKSAAKKAPANKKAAAAKKAPAAKAATKTKAKGKAKAKKRGA